MTSEQKKATSNPILRAVRSITSRFSASFRPSLPVQVDQYREEGGFREDYWSYIVTRVTPGLGIGYATIPYLQIWEKIWGVTPVEDYHKYKELYHKVPAIKSAVDLHVIMATAKGFQLHYDGPQTVIEDFEKFFRKHDFQHLIRVILMSMLVMGNAFVEVVRLWECKSSEDHSEIRGWQQDSRTGAWWTERIEAVLEHSEKFPHHELVNPYGIITRLKPLDPEFMRVRRGAYGEIYGYVQTLTWPYVTFFAEEILHFKYSPIVWYYEAPYGISLLRSVLFHQELITELEQTMGIITMSYAKPMFIVKMGGEKPGERPVPEQVFQSVVQSFSQRAPGSDIFVKEAGVIKEVQPINPPLSGLTNIIFWLDYLQQQRGLALFLPKTYENPTGLNRSTAEMLDQMYVTFIRSLQTILASQLERFFFPLLLRSLYGPVADELMAAYGVPKIVWPPIKEERLEVRARVAGDLFRTGLMTLNEARQLMGLPPIEQKIEEMEGEVLRGPPPGMQLSPAPSPALGRPPERAPEPEEPMREEDIDEDEEEEVITPLGQIRKEIKERSVFNKSELGEE